MEGHTELTEIPPAALKLSIRLGSVAWSLFSAGLAWYFYAGGGFPPDSEGAGILFSFTGFAGFAVGIPFAIGGLWTAVSKRRGMLQSQLSTIWELAISSSTRWKFAAGLNGAYLLLLVAYFVMASW